MVDRATLTPITLAEGEPPRALSFPFRIDAAQVATVDTGTLDHTAELVAVTALTRKGERRLVPDFGITDPTFDELDVAELEAVLATYGPVGVSVDLVEVTPRNEHTVTTTLTIAQDD